MVHGRFYALKNSSSWKAEESFPSDPIWASFYNKLLLFLDQLNGKNSRFKHHKFISDIEGRLRGNTNLRDAAFAELAVLKYLIEKKKCELIELQPTGNAPQGKNQKEGEYLIRTPDGTTIFCEVKHPGWKCSKGPERRGKPKYFNGDSGAVTNESDLKNIISKAYEKFLPDKINLLIINDDFIISNNRENYTSINTVLYGREYGLPQGIFNDRRYMNLGAIAIYNYDMPSPFTCVRETWRLFKNANAESLFHTNDLN